GGGAGGRPPARTRPGVAPGGGRGGRAPRGGGGGRAGGGARPGPPRRWPGEPGGGQAGGDATVGHVDRAAPGPRLLGEFREQQFRELLALARPPAVRIPAEQAAPAALAPAGGRRLP